jgi:hypothetical protein
MRAGCGKNRDALAFLTPRRCGPECVFLVSQQQRTMGLDTDALSAQIEERKNREQQEREWNATAGVLAV